MPQKKVTRVEFPTKPLLPSQSTLLKRVAAYARVSTVKDSQENSLQSQQEYFTEYIRHHPDWVFAGMYTDDGVSGLSIRRRDNFNRMVNDALDGKIDLILTKSLSRFARNTVDALTTIRKLKAAGVAVYFQRENINTMDSTGEFLLTLMSSFAEEESRSISENVTWAVRHRYAQGIYHLPGLLLGYRRSLDGEIQVDEAGARVVRFIYLLALAEKSSTDICRILMEYNISSPGESKVWESKTVRSILKNEKYMGDAILQKQVTVDFLTKTSNYGLTVEKKIIDAVAVIANENRYHPVCDFLNALQWDGTERIRFCLHRFLGSDTDDYTYEALKLFLLGAISRAFKPGCKFEVMLCLVGGQGAGKSSFFRLLAVNDDWFSDDLKKLDDENVYRKMQGHWIIEMSEMIATANAKSIEEIKSFLSRQKETYKIPYETHPADRKRQCVFGGSSNTLDFLPLDRTGNRRFVPVMVYPERAEVHILADEQASREYINQMWAEAMEIYRSGNFRLRFSPAMNAYLKAHQKDFMPEDTKAGQILDYLERYSGSIVCSKQLYKEALGHDYDEPKQWELREINDIMNNAVTGWRAFSNPRYFPEPYRRQKGWERIRNDNEPDNSMDGFQEIPTEEMEQLGLPEEWLKQK